MRQLSLYSARFTMSNNLTNMGAAHTITANSMTMNGNVDASFQMT
ncbi:MAG: hypothetical protein NT120_00460 [Candidatus Aenigmarchaeota archaeon]|nr:hypothetical protein [Candidatus Aenigmarchaeota archaeon]